jgi:hypothetical protein
MTHEKQHNMQHEGMNSDYKKGSISLGGAVAMGTGVMIGSGIFALTGQIAQLAGPWFPLAFVVGAIVSGFSAYSYIQMSNAAYRVDFELRDFTSYWWPIVDNARLCITLGQH